MATIPERLIRFPTRLLFTEVFGIDPSLDDEAVIDARCESFRGLMEKSGIPLTLSAYGECPSKEFVQNNLAEEDFGEFSPDETAIEDAVRRAKQRFGSIDVLVNNAGYGYRAAVEEGSVEDTKKLFDTNFWGPVALIKAVLPDMRKRHSGVIINVSSIAALQTAPGSGYYAASKCALEGLSGGLRAETGPLGIKVMVVEPGAFRTDFAGRSLTQSEKVIEDYEQTAGARRIGKDTSHGTQPGDPDKAAELLIQVVLAEDVPFRLLLGTDAVTFADHVMQSRTEEYAKWKNFSCKSDF